MRYIPFLLLLLAISISASCQSRNLSTVDNNDKAVAEVKEVTVDETNKVIASNDVQFIDVRTTAEFEGGHAIKAVNYPLDSLNKDLEKLDKTKPTYLICQTGRRSLEGAKILNQAGFKEVYSVNGGTTAWKTAGLQTETSSKTDSKSKVDEKTKQALLDALADERRAEATYQAVLKKFGDARPFINIIEAEKRHQSMLLPLFEKYVVEVPKNEFEAGKITVPETLIEACKTGIAAEKENIAIYDKFFEFVKEQDILDVFKYLQTASKENHLPAFTRCAEGRGGMGYGRGRGRRFQN
jgi:rhodanese-related sulfurtransferase